MTKHNSRKGKDKADRILDLQGLMCPMPTVMTIKALKEMQKGKSLQIVTNDASAKDTIPPICEQEGYQLLDLTETEGLFYITIRK